MMDQQQDLPERMEQPLNNNEDEVKHAEEVPSFREQTLIKRSNSIVVDVPNNNDTRSVSSTCPSVDHTGSSCSVSSPNTKKDALSSSSSDPTRLCKRSESSPTTTDTNTSCKDALQCLAWSGFQKKKGRLYGRSQEMKQLQECFSRRYHHPLVDNDNLPVSSKNVRRIVLHLGALFCVICLFGSFQVQHMPTLFISAFSPTTFSTVNNNNHRRLFQRKSPIRNGHGENDDASDDAEVDETGVTVSRRAVVLDLPILAMGSAVVTGELLGMALGGLSLSRPPAHEQRVADTVRRTLVEAALPQSSVVKVLEVGIGADCRLIRRGLYNQGIQQLASTSTARKLEITGIDLTIPKESNVQDAQLLLDQLGQETGVQTTLQVQAGSITDRLPFADGSFDAVICCLTLCSVSDPTAAIRELQRLVRPNGGTFGYVEHVAVNPNEPYRFLEWQQTTLDPLQQLVAENCHLHRYTQETIHQVFSQSNTKILQEDRFLVDKMWPVTSQSCGVIQRLA